MTIPDWQLPRGVDRGLWDYFRSSEMVSRYDDQLAGSALAAIDVPFCERHFRVGTLLDLGCGTGRLIRALAPRGYECVGVDLSEEMLSAARRNCPQAGWLKANIVEPGPWADGSFGNIACLFSTFGMVRGEEPRASVLRNVRRLLKPGGRFVLHVHHRGCRTLGLKRYWTREFTMPQAYGGAPLTIRHFAAGEAERLLAAAGLRVVEVLAVGLTGEPPRRRGDIYGWLIAAE